jgi:hypothetical protein
MTHGLPVSMVKSETEIFVKENILPAWDLDLHPKTFLAMTGRESGEIIAPLEPDIVGEHFALSCLAQNNLSDAHRARLCALAWGLSPLGMAQLMLLSHRDVPNHPMLPFVRKAPPFEGNPELVWAIASVNLMNDFPLRDLKASRALHSEMRSIADTRGEPALWGHESYDCS